MGDTELRFIRNMVSGRHGGRDQARYTVTAGGGWLCKLSWLDGSIIWTDGWEFLFFSVNYYRP